MKKVFSLLVFCLLTYAASAQSAEKISQILDSQEISYGQSAWLACSLDQIVSDNDSFDNALSEAVNKGWLSSGAVSDKPIKLQELCGIFVKASGLKCGLFYRLTKADRYAFKELKANGTLDSYADPAMTVTGQNAVSIFNACVKKAGGEQWLF